MGAHSAGTPTLTTADQVKIIVPAVKRFSSRLTEIGGLAGHFVLLVCPPLGNLFPWWSPTLPSAPGLMGIFSGRTCWTPATPQAGLALAPPHFFSQLFLSHLHLPSNERTSSVIAQWMATHSPELALHNENTVLLPAAALVPSTVPTSQCLQMDDEWISEWLTSTLPFFQNQLHVVVGWIMVPLERPKS